MGPGGRFKPVGLYALACLLALTFIVLRLAPGGALDTDIQSLLPAQALKPPIRESMVQAGVAASSRVAMLVSGPDPETANAAARDLKSRLEDSGVFVDAAVDGEETARWLFANRNQLRCEPRPEDFTPALADEIVRSSLVQIYSPVGPVSGDMLQRDPFLLTLRLSSCLLPANGFGVPMADGSVLISGRLTGSAFRLDTQKQFIDVVRAWSSLQAPKGVTLARAGAAFHAEDGAHHAQRDVSTVGLASTLGIVLLLLLVFRRPRAIPITLLVVAAGYLGSLAAVLAVFKTVHMLTFVFGSAFVGVTADYAIYYLCTGPLTGWGSQAERRAMILRPVTVCMITSAIGFSCLALFGVPIFTQMAVFACGGLVSAWACAFTVIPLIDPDAGEARRARLVEIWHGLEELRGRLVWNRTTLALVTILFLAGGAWTVGRMQVLDDVRKFQPRSAVLVAEEARVRAASGIGFSPNFLLSWGSSPAEARAQETAVLGRLSGAARDSILSPSRFDPPAQERSATQETLESLLIRPHLGDRAALLGQDPDQFQPLAKPEGVGLPNWIGSLSGNTGRISYLIAPTPDSAAKEVISVTRGMAGATYVDPADAYSQAFGDYRRAASLAVAAAFGAVGVILLAIYRRPWALGILIAPGLGVLGGIIVASVLGAPLSFFSMMGAFVVVGTGADYSILRYEAAIGRKSPLAGLPILITALTAILSMGLLSLSSTYPVRSFGIAVAAGLAISYGFSFVAAWFGSQHVRKA